MKRNKLKSPLEFRLKNWHGEDWHTPKGRTIRDIFREFGFQEDDLEVAVRRITSNKDLWLKFMIQEEIGVVVAFLFVLGVWKTRITKGHWLRSGIETLIFGGISCGIGFLLGRIIAVLVH